MAREIKPIDISRIPELLTIAEEVRSTGEPRLLKRDGEELALLSPVRQTRRTRKTGLVTKDDALLRLIGIGRSGIAGGVSGKKHEYLARALRPD